MNVAAELQCLEQDRDMKLTAAVIQNSTVLLDTPATVERALALMKEAAAQGCLLYTSDAADE